MKKDRNSFFQEYNMSSINNTPMMQMYPNQVSSQSSFYSGPAIYDGYPNNAMMQNNMMDNTYTSDIESRISKIERQINRIEARLKNIENELNSNYSTKDTNDSVYNNNLYMV